MRRPQWYNCHAGNCSDWPEVIVNSSGGPSNGKWLFQIPAGWLWEPCQALQCLWLEFLKEVKASFLWNSCLNFLLKLWLTKFQQTCDTMWYGHCDMFSLLLFFCSGPNCINYTVSSLNVRGLNTPFKRTHLSTILDSLKRKDVDVALLSEAYLKPNDIQQMQNSQFFCGCFLWRWLQDQRGKDFNETQLKCFNWNNQFKWIKETNLRWNFCLLTEKSCICEYLCPNSFQLYLFPWLTKELFSLSKFSFI